MKGDAHVGNGWSWISAGFIIFLRWRNVNDLAGVYQYRKP
jgi:hypothetical protein